MTDASTNQFVRKMMKAISFENSTSTILTQNPEGNSTFFFYSSSNDFFFPNKDFLKVICLSFPFGIIITKVKMFSVFFGYDI